MSPPRFLPTCYILILVEHGVERESFNVIQALLSNIQALLYYLHSFNLKYKAQHQMKKVNSIVAKTSSKSHFVVADMWKETSYILPSSFKPLPFAQREKY